LEADNLERLTLETKECWRPIQDSDYKENPSIEVIPSVVIYSRKRDGRFKARLV